MAELKVEKVMNLHGEVIVEEETVMSLSATISSDPNRATNYTESVTDTNKYYTTREDVREQIAAFRAKMHEAEDSLVEVEDVPVEEPQEAPIEEGE